MLMFVLGCDSGKPTDPIKLPDDLFVVTPFRDYRSDCHQLLDEVLLHLSDSFYQPPHWSVQPSESELLSEQEMLEECQQSASVAKEKANRLYYALTGQWPVCNKDESIDYIHRICFATRS